MIFAALYFVAIFPSAIWSHLAYVAAPSLVVLALVGDRIQGWLRTWSPTGSRIWAGSFAVLTAAGMIAEARTAADVRRWYPIALGLPGASVFVSADQAALFRGAVRFIDACAQPGAPVFVAPDIPLLYLLSGRPNPTPYDLTIPGNVSGELIVERLEATRTRCIVYNPNMYPEFPPFEELFPQLARHLDRAYRRAQIIRGGGREWHGLVRRAAEPSGGEHPASEAQ